jgi:hypothetical protein
MSEENLPVPVNPKTNSLETKEFKLPTGASAGYILTCDSVGLASWAAPAGGSTTATGTAGQIAVNGSYTVPQAGSLTFSLPQNILPASSPIFVTLTLSALTASRLIATDSSKQLVSAALNAWIAGTANQIIVTDDFDGSVTLSTPQNIGTGSSPTFAGLTLSAPLTIGNGGTGRSTATAKTLVYIDASGTYQYFTMLDGELLIGSTGNTPIKTTLTAGVGVTITNGPGSITIAAPGSGVASLQGTASQILVNGLTTAQTGPCVLTLPQNISNTSSPVFNLLTLTGLTASRYVKTNGSSVLTTVATIPITDITGITASLPLQYSAGTFSIDYNTTNMKLTSNRLNTIQDIATSANPQFNRLYLNATPQVDYTILQMYNGERTKDNYFYFIKYNPAGLDVFETIGLTQFLGYNSAGGVYPGGSYYCYNNSSVAGNETATTIFESILNGSLSTVFAFVGHSILVPKLTASTYAYVDINNYLVSRSDANFASDVRSKLSSGSSINYNSTTGVIDTIQDLRTSASPTFVAATLSGATASTYAYYDGAKLLGSRSSGNFTSDVRSCFSAGNSITLVLGVIDTIQDLRSSASPTFVAATLSGATASTYAYFDGSKVLGSRSSANFASDVRAQFTAGNSITLVSGLIDTIQDLQTSASPTFVAVTLSGATASTYAYYDGSKLLGSRSASNFASDVRSQFSAGTSITIATGVIDTIQDLRTSASPTFAGMTLSASADNVSMNMVNTSTDAGQTNIRTISRYKTGGLVVGQIIYEDQFQGYNSSNVTKLFCIMRASCYSSTAGAEYGELNWFCMNNGTSTNVFSVRGNSFYLHAITADRLTYVDINNIVKSANTSSNLIFNSGTLDTVQNISIGSSPTFTALTLSGLTASQYIKTDGLKQLVSASSIPASDITGMSGASPITYSTGSIGFDYKMSSSLLMQNNMLLLKTGDTNNGLKYDNGGGLDGATLFGNTTISFQTFSGGSQEVARINTTSLNLPLQTASTYAYLDGSKNVVSRSGANFTSDVRAQFSAGSGISIASGVISSSSTITSGSYTPTVTNVYANTSCNVDITIMKATYMRIGSVCNVNGFLRINLPAIQPGDYAPPSRISFQFPPPIGRAPSTDDVYGSWSLRYTFTGNDVVKLLLTGNETDASGPSPFFRSYCYGETYMVGSDYDFNFQFSYTIQ